jgi:hypothetical protein
MTYILEKIARPLKDMAFFSFLMRYLMTNIFLINITLMFEIITLKTVKRQLDEKQTPLEFILGLTLTIILNGAFWTIMMIFFCTFKPNLK